MLQRIDRDGLGQLDVMETNRMKGNLHSIIITHHSPYEVVSDRCLKRILTGL